jgi:hypothetical protein
MSETAVKTCFVIGPIGDAGSPTRVNADWLLKGIIQPILTEKFKFHVRRSDEIPRPGMIDSQVINAVIDADLVIADLSENNPNAFYELAIRHMEARPVIHMARDLKHLPFDVLPYRTIPFSTVSYEDVEKAKSELEKQVNEALSPDHEVDNPITTARGKKKWQETATTTEKIIMDSLNTLADRVTAAERNIAGLVTPPWIRDTVNVSPFRGDGTAGYAFLNPGVPAGPLPLRSGVVPSGETGLPWSQVTSTEPPKESS